MKVGLRLLCAGLALGGLLGALLGRGFLSRSLFRSSLLGRLLLRTLLLGGRLLCGRFLCFALLCSHLMPPWNRNRPYSPFPRVCCKTYIATYCDVSTKKVRVRCGRLGTSA